MSAGTYSIVAGIIGILGLLADLGLIVVVATMVRGRARLLGISGLALWILAFVVGAVVPPLISYVGSGDSGIEVLTVSNALSQLIGIAGSVLVVIAIVAAYREHRAPQSAPAPGPGQPGQPSQWGQPGPYGR